MFISNNIVNASMNLKRVTRLVLLGVAVVSSTPLAAAQLLVMEQPGCVWCARFEDEIAPAWPKTEEGKFAPLRRVDITKPWPKDLEHIRKERFTPTFVLIDGGREIGRLRGYPGDEFFWYRIDELIEEAKDAGGD